MLRFKQFVKNLYIPLFEHLTPEDQQSVDDKSLDTSVGKEVTKGVIPDGQYHTEVPMESPLQLAIKAHLHKNPSQHGHWKLLDSNTVQSPDYVDPTGVKRTGYKKPLSQVLKNNPELLKAYSDSRTKSTSKSDSPTSSDDPVKGHKGSIRWKTSIDPSKFKIIVSRHPYAIQGKSSDDKPWQSCARLGNTSFAAGNLDDDVEKGGGVAYLVHHDEPDPNNPHKAIGRVALQPFVSASGHRIWRASPKRYGADDEYESFHNTVKNWAEDNFPMKDHEYRLDPSVYQGDHDEDQKTITKPLDDKEKAEYAKKLHDKLDQGTETSGGIEHAIKHGYLDDSHIDKITKNPLTSYDSNLVKAHNDGKIKLNKNHIDNMFNKNNSMAHASLLDSHIKGNLKLDKSHIDKLVHGNSAYNHNLLSTGYRDGKVDLTNDHLDHITSTPSSDTAHQTLALAHAEGKIKLSNKQIDNIINNEGSINAHASLARGTASRWDDGDRKYPKEGLTKEQIDTLVNNRDSVGAHHQLIDSHVRGGVNKLSKEQIDTLINHNRPSVNTALAENHGNGLDLSEDQVNKIIKDPKSNEAHGQLLANHANSLSENKKPLLKNYQIDHIITHNDPDIHSGLVVRHYHGTSPLTSHQLNHITKNRGSSRAIDQLVSFHVGGHIKLDKEHIDNILNNPNASEYSHDMLKNAHDNGIIKLTDDQVKKLNDKDTIRNPAVKEKLDNPNTDYSTISNLAEKSNDPDTHLAILDHPNSFSATDKIASKTTNPEVIKKLLGKHSAHTTLLRRHENGEIHLTDEQHKNLLHHYSMDNPRVRDSINNTAKTNPSDLVSYALNSRDPKTQLALLNHPIIKNERGMIGHGLSDALVDRIADNAKHPDVHKAVVNSNRASGHALDTIARRTNNIDLHRAIAKHPETRWETLRYLGQHENASDPEIKSILKKREDDDIKI